MRIMPEVARSGFLLKTPGQQNIHWTRCGSRLRFRNKPGLIDLRLCPALLAILPWKSAHGRCPHSPNRHLLSRTNAALRMRRTFASGAVTQRGLPSLSSKPKSAESRRERSFPLDPQRRNQAVLEPCEGNNASKKTRPRADDRTLAHAIASGEHKLPLLYCMRTSTTTELVPLSGRMVVSFGRQPQVPPCPPP
jgi:hypothetical protein